MIKNLSKIILVLAVISGCSDSCFLPESPERIKGVPYFRDTVWGMTIEQVEAAEKESKASWSSTHNVTYTDVEVYGFMTQSIWYYFDDDKKLNGASCNFASWLIDDYNAAFGTLKEILTQMYGDDYEEHYYERELHDGNTDYTYSVSWDKQGTNIQLTLSCIVDFGGQSQWFGLVINYTAK